MSENCIAVRCNFLTTDSSGACTTAISPEVLFRMATQGEFHSEIDVIALLLCVPCIGSPVQLLESTVNFVKKEVLATKSAALLMLSEVARFLEFWFELQPKQLLGGPADVRHAFSTLAFVLQDAHALSHARCHLCFHSARPDCLFKYKAFENVCSVCPTRANRF